MRETNSLNTSICQHPGFLLRLPYKCENSEQGKVLLNVLKAILVHVESGRHPPSRRECSSHCKGTLVGWHRERKGSLQTTN